MDRRSGANGAETGAASAGSAGSGKTVKPSRLSRPKATVSTRPVNDDELLIELDRRSQGYGAGVRTARELGIEPTYLNDMKSGIRKPNSKVAAGLGFELRWVRLKPSSTASAGKRKRPLAK